MNIGAKIRLKRKELNYTLEELASKVGVSKQTIQRYETGVISNIPSDKIEKIANALSTTPAYLMGWEEKTDVSTRQAAPPELTSKDEKDIAKDLASTLDQLESSQSALMFDGEPMDDETRELLKISLENSIRLGKQIAKQKYTNKRYKKD